MNQHLGASYTLSVLIVVAFALLMAGSDTPPLAKGKSIAAESSSSPPGRVASERAERPSPAVVETAAVKPMPVSRVVAATIDASPVVHPVSHVRAVPTARPRDGFTTVASGESLADVARRVYGPSAEVAKLWRANRDQLPDVATPPRVGMTLRTP